MTSSLLALAAFLFLFLKKTFENEVAELKKETGYVFVNSIRGTEGRMMERLLFRKMDRRRDTINHIWTRGRHRHISPDTSMLFAFIDDKRGLIRQDTSFEITIRSEGASGNLSNIEGSMSVMIAMDAEGEMTDSIFLDSKMGDVLERLQKGFSENMERAALPVDYKVIKLDTQIADSFELLETGTYTDIASGERYGVRLSEFNGYILKKIMPQILFSVGLFSIVSLAFFTVFKNLKKQQKLTELKNDFIQNVTHELKTPIATVGVAIEALQDFDALKNPERTKEYLDISKNELSRLSLLVDKVLKMSLFEKTELELKFETVDLTEIINGVVSSMKLQFEKHHAKVIFENNMPFKLQGDRLHLTSVIYNLLDNAIKYGNEKPLINIDLSSNEKEINLKIKDNGKGVPTEFQEKVFEKFFRVPSGDRHDVKGHGLGLSYVASVVEKHGGKISLESKEGEGSVFAVQLPIQKP